MEPVLRQSQGRVVTGELFWDREVEKELFIEKIKEGGHLLLVAQRRMGKTSLMAEAHRTLKDEHGFDCVFVDVQSAKSASDFVVSLCDKCRGHTGWLDKIKELFANVFENVDEIGMGEFGVKIRAGLNRGNWRDKGSKILDILAEQEKPVVLFFDEVPIMVNNMLKGDDFKMTPERRGEANEFMSWVREKSIQHQGKIRFVIAGSIGLEPVLKQAGLSATINNFNAFDLKPWDKETTEGCLNALANQYGVEFEEGVGGEIYEKLGCGIPHHVQMFFGHVYDCCKKRRDMTCTIGDVEKIYKGEMLSVRGHTDLTHYEERLKQVLGQEKQRFALEMLTEAAVTGLLSVEAIRAFQGEYEFEEEDTVEVQKEILWVLEHDGYLEQKDGGFVFVSKLLADWWRSRHCAYYESILKREV